ncbi:MAG TPA: hypothetical protein VM450_15250 [Thermomicrobiales bacterium]|nr:hypothetical protein [Thermomicrobiales bacterium]
MRSLRVVWNRHLTHVLSLLAVAVLLTACGGGGDPEPTPTPAPPPTAAPGALTVGDLLARVDAAWPQVTSMRVTSTAGPVPTDDATVTSGVETTIEETVAPDSRRIVRQTDGATTDEQVYVGGTVYMYGAFVAGAVAPEVGPGTWITVDPAAVPDDTPVGYQLSYLMRPQGAPFGSISAGMRARPVTDAGQAQVGGRICRVYSFIDATDMGDRVEYELALDEHDLPCQLVQRAGGFQNSSVFEVNVPGLTIVAPDAPTPVSGTPEG